jgi:hypothetical protein
MTIFSKGGGKSRLCDLVALSRAIAPNFYFLPSSSNAAATLPTLRIPEVVGHVKWAAAAGLPLLLLLFSLYGSKKFCMATATMWKEGKKEGEQLCLVWGKEAEGGDWIGLVLGR